MFQDIVILNKVDLVSAEGSGAMEELEEEILNINSLVEIIHSVRCQVDSSKILNRHVYDIVLNYTYLLFICLDDYNLPCLSFQHATHLEALLEESHSLSSNKLHLFNDIIIRGKPFNQTKANFISHTLGK